MKTKWCDDNEFEERKHCRIRQLSSKVILKSLCFLGADKLLTDKAFLSLRFMAKFGQKLDLDNPRGFNEKIQWLKINDMNPLYSELVDKIAVKKWVSERIGEEYVPKILKVWDSGDVIDIGSLPQRFALKTNHDSGGVVVCKDKESFDVAAAEKKLRQHLKVNYYWPGRERPYRNVVPQIFAEEFIGDGSKAGIIDYKILCFDGKAECLFTCTGREFDDLRVDFFDTAWNHLPFTRHYPNADSVPLRPTCLQHMIKLAERLAEGIPFVRVDFYEVDERLLFGEMTFYPGAGFEEFEPPEWDLRLGSLLKLDFDGNSRTNDESNALWLVD